MAKSKQPPAAAPRAAEVDSTSVNHLSARADELFRAAAECLRQRERYALLVEAGADDREQKAAFEMACSCDSFLESAIELYGKAAAHDATHAKDGWWRRANALWLASREYERHHRDCDRVSRRLNEHDPAALAALTMEYDLEASALLALRHAIDGYRQERPEAELRHRAASAARA